MKNIGGYLLAGGIGAMIGSGLTLLFIRKKVQETIQSKVDEAKIEKLKYERLVAKYGVLTEMITVSEKDVVKKPEFEEDPSSIVVPVEKNNDYTSYFEKKEEPSVTYNGGPYVIGEAENKSSPVGSIWGYDYAHLTYYADKVLADEWDKKMDKQTIIDVLGEDWKNRFGEVDANIVYVRNDELKCDYEIALDDRTYSEVAGED